MMAPPIFPLVPGYGFGLLISLKKRKQRTATRAQTAYMLKEYPMINAAKQTIVMTKKNMLDLLFSFKVVCHLYISNK